jgi:mevalonate kinase
MAQGFGKAHGKIILIGEHSVVYNHPAIALPLLSATVECVVKKAGEDTLISPTYKGLYKDAPEIFKPTKDLFKSLQKELNLPALELTIHPNFMPYGGLGFSAALASSITEALYDYAKKPLTELKRFNWTQYSERIAHQNPSGIDATLVASKQALIYQKHMPSKGLHLHLPGYLIVGPSGVAGETKKAVKKIASTMHEASTQNTINQLGELTASMINYIQTQNLKRIGESMTQAHKHLTALGVSHTQLNSMVEAALSHGALGAKLSGGGLGGSVIALSDNQKVAETILGHWENITKIKGWILSLKEV